jgi:hypothetical protein
VDCYATKEDLKRRVDGTSTRNTNEMHNRCTNTLESIPLLFQIPFTFNARCAVAMSGPPVDCIEKDADIAFRERCANGHYHSGSMAVLFFVSELCLLVILYIGRSECSKTMESQEAN